MRTSILVVALTVVACGSSSSNDGDKDPPAKAPPANPCATPGATYLQSFTTVSGNCGEVPAQIVNISDDGTVPSAAGESCQTVEQDGCRAHDTGCKVVQDGCTTTATTDITFADDGSSASGLFSATIKCSDGSSCSGTYQVMMVRQ